MRITKSTLSALFFVALLLVFLVAGTAPAQAQLSDRDLLEAVPLPHSGDARSLTEMQRER